MGASTLVLLLIGAGFTVTVLVALVRNLQATGPATPRTRLAPKASAREKASKATSPGSPFRAVSIAPGPKPCAAVKALQGKFYLVELGDVPNLPLFGCDKSKCGCRYSHHADRRSSEEDRRTIAGIRTELHGQAGNGENRKNKGRRATDQSPK